MLGIALCGNGVGVIVHGGVGIVAVFCMYVLVL